jgi:hypothetical protein
MDPNMVSSAKIDQIQKELRKKALKEKEAKTSSKPKKIIKKSCLTKESKDQLVNFVSK